MNDMIFPDPGQTNGDLIMVGGSVTAENIISAYKKGIFPWYSEKEPVVWWSLDPRFVLFPSRPHISRSLIREIRRQNYELSLDKAFREVIEGCQKIQRPGQSGTWIVEEMLEAYCELHYRGLAHSVEVWDEGELLGGLYGVSLGNCFFGESMYARRSNVSRIAFVALIGFLDDHGFGLIDCQVQTRHLGSFGAMDMPRNNFLKLLKKEISRPGINGNWEQMFQDFPKSSLWDAILTR